jgi:hypothetical protein
MTDRHDPLTERFGALAGAHDDADWLDVRRRARRRGRRLGAGVAAAAVVIGLLAAPPIGLGGRIVGLFREPGKPVRLGQLASNDRGFVLTSFCRKLALVVPPGRAPQTRCMDGRATPVGTGIANDDSHAYWKIAYPDGRVCLASGSARIRHSRIVGDRQFGSVACGEDANIARLLPSPKRPITAEVAGSMSVQDRVMRLFRVSGLAGDGVAAVSVVDAEGFSVATPVKGHIYSLSGLPDKRWVALVARDADGHEVYREPLGLNERRAAPPPPAKAELPPPPPPPPPPSGTPLQHAEIPGATIDVYRSGAVVHFTSDNGPLAFVRSHLGGNDSVAVECGDVAFGAGRWGVLNTSSSATFGRELRATFAQAPFRGGPEPPFDACSVRGKYGRRWDEHVGYHNAVEFPFNATAERFFAEQAAARRVAYFVRSPKMREIRRALKGGGTAPSSAEIASRFDESVVALASRDETPPAGKVGIWSDGDSTIVAAERADDGRRMYVTLQRGRIGEHNLHTLAFVF